MAVVNHDFNFIPNFMLSENSKFYSELVNFGFNRTEVGLYYPSGKVIPIIEHNTNTP